ncbi:MAG: hypothetical protein IT208_06665 [Chthonomonadales bacterium]|nr:hypothetical protein [Chthonomonadales bacterium]
MSAEVNRRQLLQLGAAAAASLAAGGAGAAPPGSASIIEGVGHYQVMDPLFEAVRVALAHRGDTYPPEYVQGISGSAFRMGGVCPCAPTSSYATWPDELARTLGYEADWLKGWGPGVDQRRRMLEVLERVRAEVRAGRPALVWHAFSSYEWDVVCGFDDAERLVGRGSHAGAQEYAAAPQERPAACDIIPGAIVIGRKVGTLDRRRAELDALEEAVRHARSPRDCFLAEGGDRAIPWCFREGLACYDAWIRGFHADPERVPGAGDRYCAGVYASTRSAAPAFLRELAGRYPAAREHLERAAERFAEDAAALREGRDALLEGWDGWRQPDRRKARRMLALLRRARGAHAAAMRELEGALRILAPERAQAARRPARVERGEGRAVVRGMGALERGRGEACTFVGALASALKTTEHPYRYVDLMGLSGLAFRARWSNDDTATKWCPSCAVGEMPDEMDALSRLTGWELRVETHANSTAPDPTRAERLRAALEAGRPVLTYAGSTDVALACGFEDGGRTLLVWRYGSGDAPTRLPAERLGPMQVYLGRWRRPPGLATALREALCLAVRNARRERHDGGIAGREYWYGDAALAAWIRDLERWDGLAEASRQALRGLHRWVLGSLYDARKAAVSFLRDWSLATDGAPRAALTRAADRYAAEVTLLESVLPPPGDEPDWGLAGRADAVSALRRTRRMEVEAVGDLSRAAEGMAG